MAARVSSPVLIGRQAELERLRSALAATHEHGMRAVVIGGEAGVGKTRLVAEFAEVARAAGALVIQGGSIDLGEGSLPYAPLVEALRGLVREMPPDDIDAALGTGRAELARLMPDLGPASDVPGPQSVDWAQARLFELVLGLLEHVAARAPLVLVVEDLHWSDQSTRDLLAYIVRNLRDAPVALILTYRSDELHRRHPLLPFLAELGRSERVERIELQPFDARESAAQLRAIAGHDLDPALVGSIHARAGGNAFFTEELLISASDGSGELPASLRDVLLARVAQLSQPTHEFLRIAAAAGQRVDPDLVARAANLDERALYEALRECVARQVLVPDPNTGVERYAFRHALLQEAVYDDLLPGERIRLHAAFARTLEAGVADDPSRTAELAHHWYAAHDLSRAFEWAIAAGAAAQATYAFPEAMAQYERALELWDQVPDAEARAGRDRAALLAAVAAVAAFAEPSRAVSHIQEAIREVGESDRIRDGLLHERLGRYAWIAGQGALAKQAYREAMELIPAEPPSEARARAVAGLAQTLFLGGRFDESAPLADEALRLARAVGSREIEGHATNSRGVDRAMFGDFDGAIGDLSTALEIAEACGSIDDIGRAYANWAWALDLAGRTDDSVALAERAVAETERLGITRFFGTHILATEADTLFRRGRWPEAERAARRAEEIGPLATNHILVEELLARLDVARGRFEPAARRLRAVAALAERAADIQFVAPVEISLAELALWQGRPAEAVEPLATALRLLGFTPEVRLAEVYALGLRAQADLAELARARRSADDAAAASSSGRALLDEMRARHSTVEAERPAFASRSRAWLRLAEAEASRLEARPDPPAWQAAIDAWLQEEQPQVTAYLQWRLAEAILATRGDRAAASAAASQALDVATQLGAEPLRDEVLALVARARLPIASPAARRDEPAAEPASSTSGDDVARLGLTPREREVLHLVALGRTNRQIAETLFISESTAGVHVSNILGKLGVASRGEAGAVAHRLGLAGSSTEGG